jgi:predicted RNA-binding Zn-ribbon protein involved in translation (DUF1610 family)
MERHISFSGDFEVVSRDGLIPGGWYIGFACPQCGQHFAIMDDPTDSGTITLSGDAAFKSVCPNCGAASAFTAQDLVLFESAKGGSTSTA